MCQSTYLHGLFQGRKLIIIGTTSCRDVLEPMGLIDAFNTVIHVPNLSKKEHVIAVLKVKHFPFS